MNFLINIIKLFVSADDNIILFNSFAGRKYDDSPKEIFKLMASDERFKRFKFKWALYEPKKFNIPRAEVIKIDSLRYIITSLKAKIWITNSSIERGLNFKGKNTIYINTWHGTPLKKMGSDIKKGNLSFRSYGVFNIDIMTAQSDFEVEIFSQAFQIPEDHFLRCGLPRNDVLSQYTVEYREEIKNKFSIPSDKQIILYAPTFREYEKDKWKRCNFIAPVDFQKWERVLAKNFILLIRAHYEISNLLKIREDSFIKDVTFYDSLNDLMIISDILISDYSSIYFDYSIMDKPMFHFTYDYDRYIEERGVYFDIRNYISGSDNEEDLLNLITTSDLELERKKTKYFRDKYVNYYGYATKSTVDNIAYRLGL